MGVIQNAVNLMIGTTAMAARLAPGYDKKQELGQLNKLSKQIEAAKSELPKHIQEGTAAEEELNEFEKQKLNVLQRQQELNPTREGMRKLIMQRSLVNKTPLMRFDADADEVRQEQAMMEVAAAQDAKQTQKERFDAFLMNIKNILEKPKKKGTTTDDGGHK